jgi:hypothetical protein
MPAVVTVYETKAFGLTDRSDNIPGANPELLQLAMWGFETPVSLAGVLHVLKEEKVDDAARVDTR